jgi:hypothetical protein
VVLSSVNVFLSLSMALPDLCVDFCFGELPDAMPWSQSRLGSHREA